MGFYTDYINKNGNANIKRVANIEWILRKLDESIVSKTAAGFVSMLPNETTTAKYLRQDGAWEVPPDTNTDTNTTYSEMSGTTLGLVRLNGSYTFTGTINVTTPPLPS
jgi:hypothetical protein